MLLWVLFADVGTLGARPAHQRPALCAFQSLFSMLNTTTLPNNSQSGAYALAGPALNAAPTIRPRQHYLNGSDPPFADPTSSGPAHAARCRRVRYCPSLFRLRRLDVALRLLTRILLSRSIEVCFVIMPGVNFPFAVKAQKSNGVFSSSFCTCIS